MDLGAGVAGYKARLLFGEAQRSRPPWMPAHSADPLPDPLAPASAEVHSA
jgi:hypothetical protein